MVVVSALAEAGRTHSVQRNVDKASKFFSEAREMLEDNPARASLKWWSEGILLHLAHCMHILV